MNTVLMLIIVICFFVGCIVASTCGIYKTKKRIQEANHSIQECREEYSKDKKNFNWLLLCQQWKDYIIEAKASIWIMYMTIVCSLIGMGYVIFMVVCK